MAGEHAARIVALDIGGSHVTAAVVDSGARDVVDGTRVHLEVDESAESGVILDTWAKAALQAAMSAERGIERIGMAIPAPFDYARGVSLMEHKFRALYGLPVVGLLAERFGGSRLEGAGIAVANDADLFALGEWWAGSARGRERMIGLTLGTGLGSGFVARGRIVTEGAEVPAGGEIWNVPYLDGVAEDYVSGRAITASYAQASGRTLAASDVAQRAGSGDSVALGAFADMAVHLGRILEPHVARFRPQCIVVGGSLARAWALFGPRLGEALWPVECVPSARFEDATLLGAAALAQS
jgi:predicted NBD/HSP70 family sugar kinase